MNNQTANETKEFQQAEPAAQKVMTRTSELSMQTATISDRTRNLLIILGKITDLYTNLNDAVEPLYNERQLDEILDPTFIHFSNARSEVEKLLAYSIWENMGLISNKEI